jgi:hypothetical protein
MLVRSFTHLRVNVDQTLPASVECSRQDKDKYIVQNNVGISATDVREEEHTVGGAQFRPLEVCRIRKDYGIDKQCSRNGIAFHQDCNAKLKSIRN